MMKNKKDLKIGVFAGILGSILTFLFGYLTTGTFDLRFPSVIGIGFFGGVYGGLKIRQMIISGEELKATLISLIAISFLIVYNLITLLGRDIGSRWTVILWVSTVCLGIIWIMSLSRILKQKRK
jgi:hypothetical protein